MRPSYARLLERSRCYTLATMIGKILGVAFALIMWVAFVGWMVGPLIYDAVAGSGTTANVPYSPYDDGTCSANPRC
jgi:hypothetical protein